MPIDIDKDSLDTAVKKLKAREDNLQTLESISKLGSWEIDLQTKRAVWSERTYEIYGIEKETEIGFDTFFSILTPDYLKKAQDALQRAITTGEHQTLQCKVTHTHGHTIEVLINAQVIYDKQHTPLKLIGTTQDVTEYVSIKNRTKELSELLEHSSNEIYILTREDYRYLYVNQGACDALGYSVQELLNMSVFDINPDITQKEISKMQEHLKHHDHILNQTQHRRKDGSKYTVQSYIHAITYHEKPAYVLFDTDISQEIQLQKDYKKQAKILEYIHDSIIATDTEGNITSWNRGSINLFGYLPQEMMGKHILTTYDKKNSYSIKELFSILNIQESLSIEAYMLKKDNHRVLCDISLSVSKDEEGIIDGYVGYIQDITAQKKIEELLKKQTLELQYQAHHDTLTDLPNRTLFKDRLSQAIVNARRNKEKFALLFIDLDQFKKINDSLGHHIGDKVLIEAALRIQSTIREEDTLARLGGDEFTVILKNLKSIQNASHIAQDIINVMKEPITVINHNLYVTSSIGISVYPDDTTNNDNLIKYADAAMYKAKDEGRDNYQFYSRDMTAFAFERVIMESSLRVALKEDQFEVYFQPQFEAQSYKIVGMEALIRWRHPSLGLVSPVKFISIAEESGLIVEIDRVVMYKAMKLFVKWYEKGLNPGILSLNLAMKQLYKNDFLAHLVQTMNELNFQSYWLELEITEGQVMSNPELSIEKLKQINNMGIEIAIDDFGTGYSSLSYLKKFPLDKLKIDQSFVKDIPDDEDDMAITRAIIALGKSLNLVLIAEGVETEEQRDFLIENDCDLIQGYLYSVPLPEKEIETLLESKQT